ncbi:MAG: hypothetical protein COA78_11920 [Blastopirellula sp.]|nr:MAG: hypothetical protein COA78_11920 [Blastopirellula sp.]
MFGCCLMLNAFAVFAVAQKPKTFKTLVKPFLKQHCIDCHSDDTQEGDVSFEGIKGLNAENVGLWKRVWEQVALKEMPPRDELTQPELMERLHITKWITGELEREMRDKGKFQTHLHPTKGNHLDHDLLFGKLPKKLEPTSSPARIWRLHPQEHLTRLNALINQEPEFNPKQPGVRTRGDFIPPNQEGEVKVYYGLDRVIGWVGGTAAYAASITGFPPVLSTENHHGLQNYPVLYSVNGAEATQIASNAEDILRFMAYGPDAEDYQFADKTSEIDEKYKHESLRGLSQSLFYSKSPKRPMTPVYDLMNKPDSTDEDLQAAVDYLFEALTARPPTKEESVTYLGILKGAIADLGKEEGVILGLTPIFLDRDALFRSELAEYGTPDKFGRVMLQDEELALAVNAAFSYIQPDETLKQAMLEGRMKTRADVKREVTRILADDTIRKPRVLQFFREYFDYTRAGKICKDSSALKQAGGGFKNELTYYRTLFSMSANTDRLVELILEEDKDVLTELLTTDRVVIGGGQEADLFSEFVGPQKSPPKTEEDGPKKKKVVSSPLIKVVTLPKGERIYTRVAQVERGRGAQKTLTVLPADQRMGILTHPSWLVSHSDAMDNHAILRGRWIRERLLGDAVPDVPITVDAMLPDEPNTTLRHRMRVTRDSECWRCHQKMDPLGLPFEMYNHLGIYRKLELGEPVDTSGEIINSGDPALDGPVDDALDMISKLAKSERVKQVFVRHAFRYWMGRNETINDAPVLQDAYQAYTENDGSMNAMLASLLTSDAFIYRKVERE